MFEITKFNEKLSQRFIQSVQLLLFQGKFFGIVTFNAATFCPSKIHVFLNVIAGTIYALGIGYTLYLTMKEPEGAVFKATDIIILLLNVGYILTAWICAIVNRDLFIDFLVKVIDFDTKLRSMGIRIKYQRYQRRVLLEFLLRWAIIISDVGALVAIVYISGAEILVESIAYILLIMNSVICHQTSALVLMLKIRFMILNKQIENLVAFFHKNKIAQSRSTEQLFTLNKICALHHHLSKLVKLFNDIFGLVLLCMFGVSFVIIVITVFYFTSFIQLQQATFYNLINPWLSNITFITSIVYICDVCYTTIEEINRTGELIHKIDTEDHDIRDEIEMFSLQIANEQVQFNAAGFFAIDYTLIFSIIGGVTTYIIILIQLSQTIVG